MVDRIQIKLVSRHSGRYFLLLPSLKFNNNKYVNKKLRVICKFKYYNKNKPFFSTWCLCNVAHILFTFHPFRLMWNISSEPYFHLNFTLGIVGLSDKFRSRHSAANFEIKLAHSNWHACCLDCAPSVWMQTHCTMLLSEMQLSAM